MSAVACTQCGAMTATGCICAGRPMPVRLDNDWVPAQAVRDAVAAERHRIAADIATTARRLRDESKRHFDREDYILGHKSAAQAQALEDLHGELMQYCHLDGCRCLEYVGGEEGV